MAALGALLELGIWRPMRRKRAGMLQLLLVAIGLAFVLRYGIQLFAGSDARSLDVEVTTSVQFLGLRLGRAELGSSSSASWCCSPSPRSCATRASGR